MALNEIPLMALLQGKMTYANERQRVVGENVANSDTPGFTPRDLKPFSFAQALRGSDRLAPVAPAMTSAMHLAGKPVAAPSTWSPDAAPNSETRLDGNQVVLEEQMMKMSEARVDYDTAVSLYQKSLSMIRTALRKPGS